MSILDRQPAVDHFGYATRWLNRRESRPATKATEVAGPPSAIVDYRVPAGWYLDAYNRACVGQPPLRWTEYPRRGATYVKALALVLDVSEAVAIGPSRAHRLARPRQTAMAMCRETTGMSLPQIGQLFGGRDHTTVMHALRMVEERIADPEKAPAEAERRKAILAAIAQVEGRP